MLIVVQKLRNFLIELLHRLPLNDTFKPFATSTIELLLDVLQNDNEENAVLALKVTMDIYKSYKSLLEDQVQPFLDYVQELYKNMPLTVKDYFDVSSSTPAPTVTPSANLPASPSTGMDIAETSSKVLAKGANSFKTLTECPIIVVMLLQTHRQLVAASLTSLIQSVIDFLSLQAIPQLEAHSVAAAKGDIHIGVAPNIRNKPMFGELITAQVKVKINIYYSHFLIK